MSRVVLLIAGLLLSKPLFATVEAECAGAASDTEKCLYFVKGYLFGLSEASNQGKNLATVTKPENESFTERAIRTRLGMGKERVIRGQAADEFCIPHNKAVVSVAKQLQKEFSENPAHWAEVSDPILVALKQHFPCRE